MFISVASERSAKRFARRIELSIARSQSDLEGAFRLLYYSYVRAGLESPNHLGMRLTRHHCLSSTDVLIAKQGGVVISTASLIVDGELGLPAETMYGEEIDAIRRRGLRLAEVGCLADRRESPARFLHMLRRLSRLIAQAAAVRGCDGLIVAAHPKHARFYMRQLGFKRFGDLRECPYARGNPAVALLFDFEEQRGSALYEYLFGNKYTLQELAPYDWDDSTREYFSSILEQRRADAEKGKKPVVAPAPNNGVQLLTDTPKTS